MSQQKEEVTYRRGKRQPVTSTHRTVIERRSIGPGVGGSFGGQSSMRMSMTSAPLRSAPPMEGRGGEVGQFVETKKKEKHELQQLNTRMANLVEKLRVFEITNKQLNEIIEKLKRKKIPSFDEIKEYYQEELEQQRNCIKELEQEKADLASKVADLADQLEDAEQRGDLFAKQVKELEQKLEREIQQNADLRGENTLLRKQFEALEGKLKRKDDEIEMYKREVCDKNNNLQEETAKRVKAEMECQAEVEGLQFEVANLDMQCEEYKKCLSDDIPTLDIRQFIEGELKATVADLQQENARAVENIKADYEARYVSQMQALQNSQNKENLQIMKLEKEIQRLKNKNAQDAPRIPDLEAKLAKLQADYDRLKHDYDMDCEEWDKERAGMNDEIDKQRAIIESLLNELRSIDESSTSMKLELDVYNKLLEGEERNIQQVMNDAVHARSPGANALADMIEGSSMFGGHSSGGGFSSGGGGGGMMISQTISGGGGGSGEFGDMESQIAFTESTKIIVKRTAKGTLAFDSSDMKGKSVTLINNEKFNNKSLSGYKLVRKPLDGVKEIASFTFDDKSAKANGREDWNIKAGWKVRVCGSIYREHERENAKDKIINVTMSDPDWGSALLGVYTLYDSSSMEKASMTTKPQEK